MKTACFLIVLLYGLSLSGQEFTENFSFETGASSYYSILERNNKNGFNYSFHIRGSKYVNKLKISLGCEYFQKQYLSKRYLIGEAVERKHRLSRFQFPVLMNLEMFSIHKLSMSACLGVFFSDINRYDIEIFYDDKSSVIEQIKPLDTTVGVSNVFGVAFSTYIYEHVKINLSPLVNYILISDHNDQYPSYRNLPNDRFSAGVELGIEFIWE